MYPSSQDSGDAWLQWNSVIEYTQTAAYMNL